MLLAKSMTGEEVTRQIIVVLSTELEIPSHYVITAMRDRASVNDVAMRTVKILYNQVMDIGCFSHTLYLVDERMNIHVLSEFCKSWIGLFSRSPKSRLLWKDLTGLSPPSFSATRWWNRFEVMNQILTPFSDVLTFLGNGDLPPATSGNIDCLRAFPFLDLSTVIDGLKSEVAAYLAGAEDVSTRIDPIAWWKLYDTELCEECKARLAAIVYGSSIAAVNSMFKYFGIFFVLNFFANKKRRYRSANLECRSSSSAPRAWLGV